MALKESGSQGSHHSEEIVSRSEQFIEKYSKVIIWCVLGVIVLGVGIWLYICLLYTSPSPRDKRQSRMPSSA